MSFICPNCQVSFNYKCVLKKHLLRKKPCVPCVTPVIPVISVVPVAISTVSTNINISFKGSSLDEIHNKMLEYLKLNNITIINNNNLTIVKPEIITVTETVNEIVITPELVETFELLPVYEEIIPAIIEEVQETNELEEKITLENEKNKILEILDKEFKQELKKLNKIKTVTLRTEKFNNLRKKNQENIKKIKDCVKIPNNIPTLISIKKDIVIENVEQTVEYMKKLNDDLLKNDGKISRMGESIKMSDEMKDILKENIEKRDELINIKKALKLKKIVVDLPKFKIEEIKTNIIPEIDYVSLQPLKKTLTPYQISQVMDYTYKITDANLSMKDRILKYVHKGMKMDHIITIAENMD
jgi:hypothetical protein